jgi:C1A family cysteine protease
MSKSLDLKVLRAALDESAATWEMDEANPVVQMTEDERVRMLGFSPPPTVASLSQAVKADKAAPAITAELVASETSIGAPAKFDQRNIGGRNFTTVVKNQGGCGSCVAFGTVGVLETTYQRQTNNPNSGINLSEAHLFYCHGGEEGRTCANGWWPENALKKVRDKGLATDDKYPYTATQQSCAVGSGWQNSKLTSLGHTKLSTRAAMKNWIATRGSITGCFIVYQDFFSYSGGVYRHVTGNSAGGHCVEICGYDDSQAAWICKNSWGTGWGEAGYFRIGYGQCQIESWAGPYGSTGVVMRAWANNKRVSGLWSNDAANNAHVYLSGIGWRRLQNNRTATHHAMLIELAGARARGRRVNALINGNEVQEIYVI